MRIVFFLSFNARMISQQRIHVRERFRGLPLATVENKLHLLHTRSTHYELHSQRHAASNA